MYFCVMSILLVLANIFGEGPQGWNPETVFLALFLALVLGFGVGAICSSLNLIWPVTDRIVPIINQVLFYISGLFFSVGSVA